MKRHRVLPLDFDFTANVLKQAIAESWHEHENDGLRRQYESIVQEIVDRYGRDAVDGKIQNLIDIGAQAFSVVAFHNRFYRQIRHAFVVGAYYPALVAACALGERILNHLVLGLRDDFRTHTNYKTVASGESWNNWDLMIRVLVAWDVLQTEVAHEFRKLKTIRHRTLHFEQALESDDRAQALEAVGCLQSILTLQFGASGNLPWFIPDTSGGTYISKEWEDKPFIRLVYLPNAPKVGPKHRLDISEDRRRWIVDDSYEYGEAEITDEEFVTLVDEAKQQHFAEMDPKE